MQKHKTALRMKLGGYAAQIRILHREERKWRGPQTHLDRTAAGPFNMRDDLHHQRVNVFRVSARISYLAYGFLRGRYLRQVENAARSRPDWDMVLLMILMHTYADPRDVRQNFTRWIFEANLPVEVGPVPGQFVKTESPSE